MHILCIFIKHYGMHQPQKHVLYCYVYCLNTTPNYHPRLIITMLPMYYELCMCPRIKCDERAKNILFMQVYIIYYRHLLA